MKIDVHAHLWAGQYKKDKSTILKACKLLDINRIYISSIDSYYPDQNEIEHLNNLTLDFMTEYPALAGGYVYINPNHDNHMNVLEKGLRNGMEGVKLWVATKCDDSKVDGIARKCIEKNVPLLAHAFHKAIGQLEHESTAENIRNLAIRFPVLNIIMAHFGGNLYHGLRCIADLKNVYSDFSGTMIGTGDIEYAVDIIGEDRILFGTDMPGGGRQCVAQVEEAVLSQKQKDKIYRENARKIFRGIG